MTGSRTGGPTDGEAPRPPTTAPRLARNALSSAARYVLPAGLALLVTPYALGVLGADRFGLWALAGVVLTLSRVLDLGLQRAIVRAVARDHGGGTLTEGAEAVAVGRGAMALLGVAYVAVVFLARDALVADVLRLPPDLWAEARYVLVGTALVAAVEAVFMPFQAALDGIGRMDVSSAIDAVQRSVSSLAVVAVLGLGWGLPGLVWKNLATVAAAGLWYRAAATRRAPELSAVPASLAPARLRQLLAFGRHVQAVNVSALVLETVAKVALGRSVGVAAVAVYELALRVVNQLGGALLAAAAAVYPAAAERAVLPNGPAGVRSIYCGATRYLAWLVLPAYGLLFALAPSFVRVWLGPGYEDVARTMAVLGAGYLVGVLAAPAHMVAQATGGERASSLAAAATVATALAGIALLLPPRGTAGVVAAVSAGVAVGGVVVWILFARRYGTGWATVTCVGARGPIAAVAGAIAAAWVVAGRSPTLPLLAAAVALGLAAFGLVMLGSGAVGPAERTVLRSMVGRPREGSP